MRMHFPCSCVESSFYICMPVAPHQGRISPSPYQQQSFRGATGPLTVKANRGSYGPADPWHTINLSRLRSSRT